MARTLWNEIRRASGEFPVVSAEKHDNCRGQLPVAGNQRSWVGLSDSQSSAAPARRRFGVDEQPNQRAIKGSGSDIQDIQDRVVWHFTLEWAIPRSPSETFHPTPMMQWMVKFHAMGRGKQPFCATKCQVATRNIPEHLDDKTIRLPRPGSEEIFEAPKDFTCGVCGGRREIWLKWWSTWGAFQGTVSDTPKIIKSVIYIYTYIYISHRYR